MRLFQNEKGAALPLVLLILFVLTLLGTTIFMFNMGETRQVARDEDRLKAHYIARSGAHAVAAYLIDNPEVATHLINSDESTEYDFGEGTFEVLVTDVYTDEGVEYYIKSTAWVGDLKQTITVTVKEQGVITPLIANHIDINSHAAEITGGDVYYVDVEDIKFPAIVKDGEIIQINMDFPPVVLPCDDTETVFHGDCPGPSEGNFTSNTQSLTVNKSSRYNLIDMNRNLFIERVVVNPEEELHGDNLLLRADEIKLGSNDLEVTLSDNIVAIVADKFSGTGNSKIVVKGRGFFVLYVHELNPPRNIEVCTNYCDSEAHINIFVYDKDGEPGSVDMGGNDHIHGTLYAPGATVDYSGGGHQSLNGWIVADEFVGKGNIKIHRTNIKMTDTIMSLENFAIDRWRYEQVDVD